MNEIIEELAQYLKTKAHIIILTVNTDYLITHSNEFAGKITKQDLNGKSLEDIFTIYQKIDLESLVQNSETILLNLKSDREIPLSYTFTIIRQADHYLMIGEQDFDENERLVQNFIEINSELNNLTREMRVKNKELAKLSKLKNEFLGMAAHDLRNPLSIISSYCSMLLERQPDSISSEARPMISNIHKSATFMYSLLEDLLDITKIEAGKIELNYEEVNAVEYIKSIIELNQIKSLEKEIKIKFDFTQVCKKQIFIDKGKINQVLNNLLSNAIKYSSPQTEIIVNYLDNGPNFIVSVRDQGQGINPNELISLFDAYTTTSTKSTGGEKSTGLGLKIARDIVTAHFGQIWVESKLAFGTTFFVSIPFQSERARNQIKPIVEKELNLPAMADSPETKILIVDDSPMQQKLMAKLLSKFKVTVSIASDGLEAIEFLKKNQVNLIFIDEHMPNLSGPSCIKKINELKLIEKDTKIIGLSGDSPESSFADAKPHLTLQKPLKPSLLRKLIRG